MKKALIFAALIIVAIPLALIALGSSETGSRWLLRGVLSSMPGEPSIEKIEGRLSDRLTLQGMNYKSDQAAVAVDNLALSWQPSALLAGKLKITDLTVDGITINLIKGKDEEKTSEDSQFNARLPVQLDINNVLITDVSFNNGEQTRTLNKLQLSAITENNQFKIKTLLVDSDLLNATANGVVKLEQDFPLDLKAKWQVITEANGTWQGSSTANGSMDRLVFDSQLIAPFKLNLKGQVEDVLKTPRIDAQGDWRDLAWPFVSKPPQIQSREGRFTVSGLLSDYQLTLKSQLNQQYLPQASLSLDAKGGLDAVNINKLELKSNGGLLQLSGDVNWRDAVALNLVATGQHFNPGIVMPELPGDLTFSSQLKGKFEPKATQLTAEIKKLSGQLRQQPVSANGKLMLQGDQFKADALRIVSGANTVEVDGQIGEKQGSLDLSMNLPALQKLWPGLAGELEANGRIQGGWSKPTVKLMSEGKGLKFAEHGIKDMLLNIDFQPDEKRVSTVNLVANRINIAAKKMDKLIITGKGTPKQHNLNADLTAAEGSLTSALTGSLANNIWKAELSKLSVTEKVLGEWVLKDASPLRVELKPSGFDVALNEGCLVRQNSSLCTQGMYWANGDLNFQLLAKSVPSLFLQAFLPETVAMDSLIDGNIIIKRQKKILDGRYDIVLSPALVTVNSNQTKQELRLGTTSASGTIKGDKITSDVALNLSGNDYVKAKLLVDIGSSQVVSGTINASMSDFSLVKLFVPQLTELKGLLTANLGLKGTINKPLLQGNIDFKDGQVDTAQAGLRNIDLRAVAVGNSIQMKGSALPIVLNKPGTAEKFNITSKIKLDADMSMANGIAGNFRIDIPASTTISLDSRAKESQPTTKQIVLGAAVISGLIKAESLSADLNMALLKQDYLRGKLQLDMGKAQILTAQATALIQELAFVEFFAPDFSNVKGLLKADMTASGALENPQLNGEIQLTKGAIDIEKAGIKVRNIRLKASASPVNDGAIQLTGSAKSGGGKINLDGSIAMQPASQHTANIKLTGKDFEVMKLPEAQVAVSPDLLISASQQQKNITGQIDVPKAILKIQDIPENAVKVSEDEIIVGQEKPKDTLPAAPDIFTDIDVTLGKEVNFSGQGLQTNLAGKLKLIKKGTKFAMQGNVDLQKASYQRFGQDLTVRKGQFIFNGPADNPWLNVEAIRVSKSKKVTAVLALSGLLKKPQTRIYSEPSLPESEVLAYLVTGSPLNQVSKAENNVLTSAAISYGAGQAGWLTEKMGIDEFKVEEGKTLKDNLLLIGQYLTPEFYVGTRVGVFNKQANVVLKYKLSDKFNVETQAGTSQRVKLNFEIDGN